MAKSEKMQTKKTLSDGNKKKLVAAVCVVLSLAVVLLVFLTVKSPVYFSSAQKNTEENNFVIALESVRKSSGLRAEILEKYIMLRLDINSCYPDLISDFNTEKINQWNEIAAVVSKNSHLLGEKLSADAQLLSEKLNIISGCVAEYEAIKTDVLSMMDVFPEINRLHAKDTDGKNIGFTVKDEREKIDEWERQCNLLNDFSLTVPGYEGIYLLNYLIKEAQGECTDLRTATDSVISSGYSETDLVRFSAEGRKTYPDIRSSNNVSVNLLEKENYEFHMYKGICRALIESLGEFYTP